MALLHQLKGIGRRSGIFFLGAPAHMLTFDDGVVFLRQGTVQGIVAGQGALGGTIGATMSRTGEADRDERRADLSVGAYDGNGRAEVFYDQAITAVRLERSVLGQRNVKVMTERGEEKLRYPSKAWPDSQATPFLRHRYGARFSSAV